MSITESYQCNSKIRPTFCVEGLRTKCCAICESNNVCRMANRGLCDGNPIPCQSSNLYDGFPDEGVANSLCKFAKKNEL